MFLVVDSSAVLDVLVAGPAAARLIDLMFESGYELHAPHLIDVEATHTLRKLTFSRRLDPANADRLLSVLAGLPIERHAHSHLLHRMWAFRENLTAYAAAYVALAELLDAPLLTRDARLARSRGHGARIEYID